MKKNKSLLLEFQLDSLNTLMEDDDLAIATIDLLHLGVNRNRCDISRECVEKSKESFYNKPIIYRYNSHLADAFATDFEEHSRDEDPTMLIAGHIPYGSDIEYVERNGKTYVRVTCILHKVYLPHLMRILENKNGNTKVSIEILVQEGSQDDESRILTIDKFKLRGVCLLGDDIIEGIEGSQLNVVKFSKNDYNNYYNHFCQKNRLSVSEDIIQKVRSAYDSLKGNNKNVLPEDIVLAKSILVENAITKSTAHKIMKRLEEGDETTFSLLGGSEMYRIVFALAKMGTGAAIKVNKSKEKMSDTPWGDVDKTELREKVLEASNYKELVKDVYLVVEEGWEDSPSTKLKYPVMEIIDGEARYNRHGLSSALGYAKAEGEDKVVDKIEAIYKDLGIEEDGKEKKSVETLIENKLDEDNKDLEEIRDDAEAQEDDAKEEVKEQEEEKHEEEVDNAMEPHDKGEEGLEDDVDADKDYWRKKAEENAAQLEEMNKRIMALEREKEMSCMSELLKEYGVCLNEEDMKGFEKDMKKMSKDQFSAKLFEHIAKAAKEEFLQKKGDVMFSFMPAQVGMSVNQDVTLEKMSNKYSK